MERQRVERGRARAWKCDAFVKRPRSERVELAHEIARSPAGDRAGDHAELVVIELRSLSRAVVPFSRLQPQGTPAELADVSALNAALG